MHTFTRASWPDDEHDAHPVHVHVLKERRPCASLKDIQILRIQVFGVRMADVGANTEESRAW